MMKSYFVFMFLLLFSFNGYSQEKETLENVKITRNAEFPGGEKAFRDEFLKMIYAYIDMDKYAVNGLFSFIFDVNANGKVANLQVLPKVKNSEMFIDDMLFAIKKVKNKWKPALKDGVPVISKKMIKINFTSDHFDHD